MKNVKNQPYNGVRGTFVDGAQAPRLRWRARCPLSQSNGYAGELLPRSRRIKNLCEFCVNGEQLDGEN